MIAVHHSGFRSSTEQGLTSPPRWPVFPAWILPSLLSPRCSVTVYTRLPTLSTRVPQLPSTQVIRQPPLVLSCLLVVELGFWPWSWRSPVKVSYPLWGLKFSLCPEFLTEGNFCLLLTGVQLALAQLVQQVAQLFSVSSHPGLVRKTKPRKQWAGCGGGRPLPEPPQERSSLYSRPQTQAPWPAERPPPRPGMRWAEPGRPQEPLQLPCFWSQRHCPLTAPYQGRSAAALLNKEYSLHQH